jgi:CRISPR/Cas system Type II protein with McrA/HNH and RuvC-like nuclease domain
MAKNKIKRCLNAICDPHPSKADLNLLWEYFDYQCAYCGIAIERASRKGHIDHLVAVSEGGSNSIYNHVLSCATCNGDEKREEAWEPFLRKKAVDAEGYQQRQDTIESWLQRAPSMLHTPEFSELREVIINTALADFDAAVAKMRSLRDS